MLRDYCADRGLPYVECGKLVVAVDRSEVARLDALEMTARHNDVPGLSRVEGSGITEIEPHAAGLLALHSPGTAITDFGAVAEAYGRDIEKSGGRLLLSTTVTGIRRGAGGIDVETPDAVHRVQRLVVCAGLQGDRVSRHG